MRLPSPEVVQAARTGQGWHWARVKRATMSGPGGGDLVLAAGPFHVDQGGVAAVSQMLAGEQAPALQPGADPGQGLPVVAGGGHGGDVGDDVGAVVVAGLGDVGEGPGPAGDLAPAGGAGGRVVGGGQGRART